MASLLCAIFILPLAVYKLDKLVLMNMELFEKYLETFRGMDY